MEVALHGFPKVEAERIEQYARDKMQKLEAILPQVIDTRCEIHKRAMTNPKRACRVQITMHVRGRLLRAEIKGDNVVAAIDGTVSKMERQIDRFKGRRRLDRRSIRDEAPVPAASEAPLADEGLEFWDEAGYIVREKEFGLSPMDVEEAIEAMELLGHDFHVFLDRSSRSLNVVYRRESGNYGLLRPRIEATG